MLPSFWNKSITVVRASKVPGLGTDTRWDWGNPVTHVVDGCFWATVTTGEDLNHREALMLGYTLRAPKNADIKSSDRIRLYVGEYDPEEPDYEIIGKVRDIPSATGSMDHKRVQLEVWEG